MRQPLIILIVLSVLAGGCSGEADLCAMASEHMEQCAGITLQLSGTCNPDRAGQLLSIPCSELGGGRGTFTSSGLGLLLGSWLGNQFDPGSISWGGSGLGDTVWDTDLGSGSWDVGWGDSSDWDVGWGGSSGSSSDIASSTWGIDNLEGWQKGLMEVCGHAALGALLCI
jgi:hypothetical protein